MSTQPESPTGPTAVPGPPASGVAPDVFDPCGPLPVGTTVLEASAGTGKTYTIASLATRFVAEGVARVEELMLVTFGRAATAELRDRVRERFVETVRALGEPTGALASGDPVLALLATGSADEVDVRRRRLTQALADFDAATITTTHGFSQQMLVELGIAADVDPDVVLVEGTRDLAAEVVSDLYLRKYATSASPRPDLSLALATAVGGAAVADRRSRLEPATADTSSSAHLRFGLASAARAEAQSRKRRLRLMDYDDLLELLCAALADPTTGEVAAERVRGRYAVVMVDEFQDTDPVQWEILVRAFHGHRPLVLIGDPKQAIYAFRGADVVTYLSATADAARTSTLGTNWRSDTPLLEAFDHLMGGVALGDPRIVVRPVLGAHPGRRLTEPGAVAAGSDGPAAAPLRIRVLDDPEGGWTRPVKEVRVAIAADVATDVVGLLSSGAELHTDGASRPVRPSDVAVLVGTNDEGELVHDALVQAGVPVVVTGTASVFASPAAGDWLALLRALEQPHRTGLARRAALSAFVGWTAEQLADPGPGGDRPGDGGPVDDWSGDGGPVDRESGDPAPPSGSRETSWSSDVGVDPFDELADRLHEWAEVLSRRGVAALLEAVAGRVSARLLAEEDGERRLTDLRHIGQVMHAVAVQEQLGVASLVEWLERRIEDADQDRAEERSRRLESDAESVQVVTVHRSKGLEFPVVYAPYLWGRWVNPEPDPLHLHDAQGERVLYVGGPGSPGYAERRPQHDAELAGESLRLAYVALTRASSCVVVHWAPTANTWTGPLHRLLFARHGDGEVAASRRLTGPDEVRAALDALAASSHGTIAVESTSGTAARWRPPPTEHPVLRVATFDRVLDDTWTRTSYSGLTAGLHDPTREPTSEPEVPGTADEPARDGPEGVDDGPLGSGADRPSASGAAVELPSPMAALPAGASFGTLVHEILETTDFTTADLEGELARRADAAGVAALTGVTASDLATALAPSLRTPLGPLATDRRLADISRADRLDELGFELPLAGGDRPSAEAATVADVAGLLRRHLPADDPLSGYAEDLDVPELAGRRLRGFLTGSIDVVLRVTVEAAPRFLVVDYKTNWLGGDRLSSADYRLEPMVRAMRDAHYPLQALLYSAALHRYLRWRQPGYDPAVHLGGVLYLFLRGLCGPDTPVVDGTTCGVFAWRPPAPLVEDLSELLAGRTGTAAPGATGTATTGRTS